MILEKVAAEAGYTRGALYHQFTGKEELAVAVVDWVAETWEREVWEPAQRGDTPVDILVALARGHIVFCRRDIARVIDGAAGASSTAGNIQWVQRSPTSAGISRSGSAP